MNQPDRTGMAPPGWTSARVTPGRGNVGLGLFDRVFFVDVFDGPLGRAQIRTLRLSGAPTGLSQVASTGHEVALEEDLAATLLVPQAGRIFSAIGSRDLVARPGQVMFLPHGRRRTVTLREGDRLFSALVLRLPDPPAGSSLANGATLDLKDFPDLAAAVDLLGGLDRPGGLADGTAGDRLQAGRRLVTEALAALEAPTVGRVPARGAEAALRRAEALMREELAEDISIRDIADRAGLGMRQMQHLFAMRHGLSPHGWLTRLRLEQAHLRLKGGMPAPSVTDAALSAGLTHLGRFPAQYRARFGTLPSAGRVALP